MPFEKTPINFTKCVKFKIKSTHFKQLKFETIIYHIWVPKQVWQDPVHFFQSALKSIILMQLFLAKCVHFKI